MQKTYEWITFFLLSIFLTTSIHAQPFDNNVAASNEQVEENSEYTAYDQSLKVAHWSAYLPITAIVVVAIFFGIADKNGEKQSSRSYDGLGSMGSKSSSSRSYTRSYHQHS
ncbi:MAG: hypothetical protein Q8K60_07745 [Parachlamydiaceae bacterium]|nr:hypothetical protein [Parachlamydiaceae bacterium]